jgi:hypothetical protein
MSKLCADLCSLAELYDKWFHNYMDMYKTVPNATFGDGKQWLKVLQHFNIMVKH